MTKEDLISIIRKGDRVTPGQAAAIADDILAGIATGIAAGRVVLHGVGIFSLHPTKARPGRNPRTGEVITVAAGRAVRFKPALALKRLLRAGAAAEAVS